MRREYADKNSVENGVDYKTEQNTADREKS